VVVWVLTACSLLAWYQLRHQQEYLLKLWKLQPQLAPAIKVGKFIIRVYHSYLDLNKDDFPFSSVCHTSTYTQSDKNPSPLNFLSPEPEVTWRTLFSAKLLLTRMAYFSKIYAVLFQGLKVLLEITAMLKNTDCETHYTAGTSECTANKIQMLCSFTVCHNLTAVTHLTSCQQL
jgi:hypothetical protein